MSDFTFIDGVVVSLFSMTLVFLVLALLSVIIEVFSKVINKFEKKPEVETTQAVVVDDDAEEKLAAQIIASCLLQKGDASNVRIKSIVRVK